jgi:hypothetical protein
VELGQAIQGLGHLAFAVVLKVVTEGEGGTGIVAVVIVEPKDDGDRVDAFAGRLPLRLAVLGGVCIQLLCMKVSS